jgi:L,D-transpeptidase catalytic domain
VNHRLCALIALVSVGAGMPLAHASGTQPDVARALLDQAHHLQPQVLDRALTAYRCALREQLVAHPGLLTLIDFGLPSTEPRLWVFDIDQRKVLYEELVAHGRGSGETFATQFSNVPESRQSSLGLFRTGETYVGRHGLSMRLDGLESGVNDHAMERAIVMHGADYVGADVIRRFGRLGRSWGCPAVRRAIAKPLVDLLRGGSLLFAYYPDHQWLDHSPFLNGCGTTVVAQAAPAPDLR